MISGQVHRILYSGVLGKCMISGQDIGHLSQIFYGECMEKHNLISISTPTSSTYKIRNAHTLPLILCIHKTHPNFQWNQTLWSHYQIGYSKILFKTINGSQAYTVYYYLWIQSTASIPWTIQECNLDIHWSNLVIIACGSS